MRIPQNRARLRKDRRAILGRTSRCRGCLLWTGAMSRPLLLSHTAELRPEHAKQDPDARRPEPSPKVNPQNPKLQPYLASKPASAPGSQDDGSCTKEAKQRTTTRSPSPPARSQSRDRIRERPVDHVREPAVILAVKGCSNITQTSGPAVWKPCFIAHSSACHG